MPQKEELNIYAVVKLYPENHDCHGKLVPTSVHLDQLKAHKQAAIENEILLKKPKPIDFPNNDKGDDDFEESMHWWMVANPHLSDDVLSCMVFPLPLDHRLVVE